MAFVCRGWAADEKRALCFLGGVIDLHKVLAELCGTNLFLFVSFPSSSHLTWDKYSTTEDEYSKAWKTAYFSIKSFSKGIQGIFDALFLIVVFVKRRCHPAEMRDNLQACIVSVVYFACLCTKDELAAVNKSQNLSMGRLRRH